MFDSVLDSFIGIWFSRDWICVQSKIQSLAGQHSDILESLSPIVRKRVESLREIQVYALFVDSSVLMLLLWIPYFL